MYIIVCVLHRLQSYQYSLFRFLSLSFSVSLVECDWITKMEKKGIKVKEKEWKRSTNWMCLYVCVDNFVSVVVGWGLYVTVVLDAKTKIKNTLFIHLRAVATWNSVRAHSLRFVLTFTKHKTFCCCCCCCCTKKEIILFFSFLLRFYSSNCVHSFAVSIYFFIFYFLLCSSFAESCFLFDISVIQLILLVCLDENFNAVKCFN